MSRFLFLPMPGLGHVNPTLAVATELVARGHQVTYLLPDQFRDTVAATGAELVEYTAPPFQPPKPGEAVEGHLAVLMQQLMATAEQVAPLLLDLYDRQRPDLVVGENFSIWGTLLVAARSARAVQLSASYPPGPHSPVTRRFPAAGNAGPPPVDTIRLAAVADRYGVRVADPASLIWGHTLPTVVFMPAEFHPDHEALGAAVHFVGPALGRPEPADGFDLSAWETTPGVYVSLGTAFNERKEFFQACLEAFAHSDRPVLVNHGRRLGAADFPDVPDNVVLASHVPQLRVLEHAAAFVTHGGMGSTMEAIFHGVPMVVVPQMVEQEATADRVAELGLGVQLDPADATPGALAKAVDTVVSDPAYRAACARMGALARAAGGAPAAADVLEAAAT
ncbi:macrolide family glycosyltransferase [Pseudonocardia xinjiangensis]|uniref:macrolide family glycosyltransferase n=1 Tax=Pseudonocardia xinjiangensis TaxID=75289 RepID=UPI003D900E7A